MTNTWYASDQAYRPSYAKIRRTVVRHIQVHLYNIKKSSIRRALIESSGPVLCVLAQTKSVVSFVGCVFFCVFFSVAYRITGY